MQETVGVRQLVAQPISDLRLEFIPRATQSTEPEARYTLSPLGCNAVRKRLFEMVTADPQRKQSAFALVGQIEVWRLEHGHPADEPRHPVIESEVSWPPLPS